MSVRVTKSGQKIPFERLSEPAPTRGIGYAMDILAEGGAARRRNWDTPSCIYIEDAGRGTDGIALARTIIHNQHGVLYPGWVATSADLLATDWEVA